MNKRIRRFIYLNVIFICIASCSSHEEKLKSRVEAISEKMMEIKYMDDFKSNKNHPAPDVENIGVNLYHKIRRFQKSKKIASTFSMIDCENQFNKRFGNGSCFEVKYRNEDGDKLRYFLKYSLKDDLFKITGY